MFRMNVLGQIDCAAITQLVEWLAVNQHVTGSSPVGGAFTGGPVA
jgi:hypothetical protein